MNIKEYLVHANMSAYQLSKICQISHVSMLKYVNDGKFPTLRIAKRIQHRTKGAITVEEILKGEDMAKKESKSQKKIHKVMHELKEGKLHSGSKKGPIVHDRKQGIAIAMSEAGMSKKKK